MSALRKWFDTEVELQKLQDTAPKAPKVPKGETEISHFRQGQGENVKERPSLPLPSRRDFLPCPFGQEDNLNEWECWVPLFDWLIEYHPEHFHAVCDAEDYLNALERQGVTTGKEYERACQELLRRFETARRLKFRADEKEWVQ
jgi:hypothetical protein